jgi:hypothetical protein
MDSQIDLDMNGEDKTKITHKFLNPGRFNQGLIRSNL